MASLTLNEKLSAAVKRESSVDVRILLEQGADPLSFASNGMNAIGVAASNGNVSILCRLLEHVHDQAAMRGCSGERMEQDEATPEGMGDLEWDEEIDERVFSPDKEWLDLYSYYARMWENIGQVLDTSAKQELKDVHCLDRHQMAPLHYAAKFGHLNCVRLLLGEYKSPVDLQTYAGQTALHFACEYQHPKICKCLLQHGASVHLKTFKVEDTALLKAAKNGSNKIVQLLLDHGASINMCNAYDVSPLIGATFFGHHDTVKLLLARGALVNLKDRDGLTALVIAVHNEATETVRCLLGHGARVIPTHNLVHTAINLNNSEILRMLILGGETVTRVKDSYGLTPMDKIIQRGNVEMLLFCYEYFRLDSAGAYDSERELMMALHCDDLERFRQMLVFFLGLGRSLDENEVFLTAMQLGKYRQLKMLLRENIQVNTEWNEEIVEMLLKRDSEENLDIMMHLVSAGLKIHSLSSLRGRWKSRVGGSRSAVEQYLQEAYTNPLSLQELSRIRIRSLVRGCKGVARANGQCEATEDHERTPFERVVWLCGLPPRLVRYLHEYSDLDTTNCAMLTLMMNRRRRSS